MYDDYKNIAGYYDYMLVKQYFEIRRWHYCKNIKMS